MEHETVLKSRRAVIGAALGGAAAVIAAGAAGPATVLAADGDALKVGDATNTATLDTVLTKSTDGGNALKTSIGNGTGFKAESTDTTPTGDFSVTSHKTAIIGATGSQANLSNNTDEVGIYGFSDVSDSSAGVIGESPLGTGVVGLGDTGMFGAGYYGVLGTGAIGVQGDVGTSSVGVYGFTGTSAAPTPPSGGIGVYARAGSTSQTALRVDGKVRFSRSGRVAVGSTATSKSVTMSGVTTSSYVIATLQTSVSGCYVRAVVPASGSFRIYLSKAPGKTVYVGYMVIN